MTFYGTKHLLAALIAILAVVVSVMLLRQGVSNACEPLDPIPVTVGATEFAIPAVLLPSLKAKDDTDFKRESQSLTGKKKFSAAGSSLRWWFCADESEEPFAANGFTLDGRWIADAVGQGELDFEYLPAVTRIIVSEGRVPPQEPVAASEFPFFSGVFQENCGVPRVLPKTSEHEITGTQCLVSSVRLSADTKLRLDFWIYESPDLPTRNAPEEWPALAREAERLIRSMRVPVGNN